KGEEYREGSFKKGLAGRTEFYQPSANGASPPGAAPPEPPPWPDALAEEAFHGLAGNFVRLVEPASEADPAALLFQLLVGFGNLVGRVPPFVAEEAQHQPNEVVVLVRP